MLTKTRQKEILKLLENRGSVTLQELKDHLNTSRIYDPSRSEYVGCTGKAGQGFRWGSCS